MEMWGCLHRLGDEMTDKVKWKVATIERHVFFVVLLLEAILFEQGMIIWMAKLSLPSFNLTTYPGLEPKTFD